MKFPNKLLKIFYCQVYLKCSASWWQVDHSPGDGLGVSRGHREDWVRDGDEVASGPVECDGLGGLRGECVVLVWTIKNLDQTHGCSSNFHLMNHGIFGVFNNLLIHVGIILQTPLKVFTRLFG